MSQVEQKVVVGLGKTGLSCARFLLGLGENVAVTDSRINPPGLSDLREEFPKVVISTGGFDETLLCSATELIVSPGVSLQEPAIRAATDKGVAAIGDIELFCRHIDRARSQIIAITGSNGKSTVTTLVGDMLKEAGRSVIVAGNIGLPVMDVLLSQHEAECYVLELSSFQLETTCSLNARVATILNISPDHLDRYDDINGYIAAKQRIYVGCQSAVINCDDAETFPHVVVEGQTVLFGRSSDETTYQIKESDGMNAVVQNDAVVIPVSDMALADGHHVSNALAALTIGHEVGIPNQSMAATLRTFTGLAHRCEVVSTVNDVTWINDSKGTNVGATVSAITGIRQAFPAGVVLIAGGEAKGADFLALAGVIEQYVDSVVLIGVDAPLIEQSLKGVCTCYQATSMQNAVEQSAALAVSSGAVLLSPACASFDMFSGFEARGEAFVAAVKGLSPAVGSVSYE